MPYTSESRQYLSMSYGANAFTLHHGAVTSFSPHYLRALHSLKNKVEADRGLSGRLRHRVQSGSLRGTSRSRSVDLTGRDNEPEGGQEEGSSDEDEDEDDSDFGSVITADEVMRSI